MRRPTILPLLIFAATVCVSVPLVLGFFGNVHPAFDSLAHFRLHFAMLLAICALPLFFTAFRLHAAVALMLAVAAFSTTSNLPSKLRLGPVQAAFVSKDAEPATYRLLQMNLRFDNKTPEKALALIGKVQPDIVTLQEVSEMWKGKLSLLDSAYPYSIICPYPNGVFGVAILSRHPFVDGTEPDCAARGAFAKATINLGDAKVDVVAIHASWPWPFEQKWQIGTMAGALAALSETALVAGDCNAAPWSAAVRRIASLGGLTIMPSVGPTWLEFGLPRSLMFAGLPIDQVFSKGAIVIHSAARLDDTGSDHLPVLVEFSIRQANERSGEDASALLSPTTKAGIAG